MQKTIKAMETKYLQPSLEMIEDVFTKWDSPEEGGRLCFGVRGLLFSEYSAGSPFSSA